MRLAGRGTVGLAVLAFAALALLFSATSAHAAFGLLPGSEGFEVQVTEPDDPALVAEGPATGGTAGLAGSHPYAMTASINFNRTTGSPGEPGVPYSEGDIRNLRLSLPPGLVENPQVVNRCSGAQFRTPRTSPFQQSASGESCPGDSQIGIVTLDSSAGGGETRSFGLFNLQAQPGSPALIGFNPYGVPVTFARQIDTTNGVYRLILEARDFPQELNVSGMTLQIWGNPWLSGHDLQRGNCLNEVDPENGFGTAAVLEEEGRHRPPPPPSMEPVSTYVAGTCSIGDPFIESFSPRAYLTLPTTCEGPLSFDLTATSWQGGTVSRTAENHDENGPVPMHGCDLRSFRANPTVQPLTNRTTTSAGLNFDLDVDQAPLVSNVSTKGRLRTETIAPSQVKQAVISLPEGMTVNPSVAAGLGVCTPAQYEAETVTSLPGAGCPNASKIGEMTVDTPLFDAPVTGGVFLAQPYQNPFDSLLGLYLIAKLPEDGLIVKVPGSVSPDPATGRLTATFEDLPQVPYTHLRVHFREGQRSLMATPSTCGDYRGGLSLVPWVDPSKVVPSDFFVTFDAGIGGGPCPVGNPPFAPTAPAGDLNRSAGSYSPFYLRPTRNDGEQEFTSYSAKLPPGLLGKIAGIPFCPDSAIEAAKHRTGVEEEQNPSCPAASGIGHTVTDYGLGSTLTYAPGGLYLAGPYHGSPLSIVAVDSATVGPFDLGVVIVRSAIKIDPLTSQVTIDSAGSDPIPHIIKGIPLYLRNIRVYISRPNFTLNPTSCAHFSIESTLVGSGLRFSDPSDDVAAAAFTPFQVSDCTSMPFKPRVSLELKGGIKRGKYPSLKATVTPRPGDANIGTAAVALPPSEFLAQQHIQTICTKPQFVARRCPPTSVYGHAQAITPLMDEPLEGPVYLRSSGNKLPDLVADISGKGIRIEVVGRIDSVKGGMRATYDVLPDAPVSKFTLTLLGGKRGLLVNSENVCDAAPATARLVGQNNVGVVLHPAVTNRKCKKHKKSKRRHKGNKK
jgi:hypothetical protein